MEFGILQITEYEMDKQGNLKHLTEVPAPNYYSHLTFMEPTNTILQKGHSLYQKYYFAKMALNIMAPQKK